MSYLGELSLEKPVSKGAALADRALEAAATLASVLSTISEGDKDIVDGAFLRLLMVAAATGKTAVDRPRGGDGEGRRRDHDRQEAVGQFAVFLLAEASARGEGHAADLWYVAKTMYPNEIGPDAGFTGLDALKKDGEQAPYTVPVAA